MKRLLNVLWAFSGLWVSLAGSAYAQQEFRSEDELIKQAGKLFSAGDHVSALPLYSNIVSNRPDNAEFNYRFGVCMVEAGAEKDDAVRYLKLASTSPQTPKEVSLYLARALHAGGYFEEALESLESYRSVASRSDWSNSVAEELQGNCQTGIAMRVNTTGVEHRILSVKECTLENFHQYYQFNDAWGKFLKVPKQYESKESIGTPEGTYLFISADGNTMLLARTDEKKSSGFDIYRAQKEITGRFSEPLKLPAVVNSPDVNEAFATVTGQGGTMYFSRRGKGSMGGYDIFMTTLQPATGRWSEPVNMGVPVNSPANDMFYVPAKDGNSCYFLSDRNSPSGGYRVIKANVTGLNDNTTVLNGKVDCRSCPSKMEIKVSVTTVSDKSLAREFKVVPESPVYSVRLQAPETYIFTVSAPGFPVFTDVVELKELSRSGYLQQVLITRDDDGKEAMRIFTQKTDESLLATSIDARPEDEMLRSSLIAQKVDEMVMTEDVGRGDTRARDNGNANTNTQDLAGIEISGQAMNGPGDGADARMPVSEVPDDKRTSITSTAGVTAETPESSKSGNRESESAEGLSATQTTQRDEEMTGGEVDLPEIGIDADGRQSAYEDLTINKQQPADEPSRLQENINGVNSVVAGEIVLADRSGEQDVIRGEFGADATDVPDLNTDEDLSVNDEGNDLTESELPSEVNISSEVGRNHMAGEDLQMNAPGTERNIDEVAGRDMSDIQQAAVAAVGGLNVSAEGGVIKGEFDATMTAGDEDNDIITESNDAVSADPAYNNNIAGTGISGTSDETGISSEGPGPVNAENTETTVVAANIVNEDQGSAYTGSLNKDDNRNSVSATDDDDGSVNGTGRDTVNGIDSNQRVAKSGNELTGAVVTSALQNSDDGNQQVEQGAEVEGITESNREVSAGRQQVNGVEKQTAGNLDINADQRAITGEFDASMTISGDDDQKQPDSGVAVATGSSARSVDDKASRPETDVTDEEAQSAVSASGGPQSEGLPQDRVTVSTSEDTDLTALTSDGATEENVSEEETTSSVDSDGNTMIAEPTTYKVTEEARIAHPELVFKVQVGAFNEADAEKLVAFFRAKGLDLLTNAVNESGMTTVMTGSYEDYVEARSQRDRIRQEGYADAFVVVFDGRNRLKISDVLKAENAE